MALLVGWFAGARVVPGWLVVAGGWVATYARSDFLIVRVLGWLIVIVPAWLPVVCLVGCSIIPVVGRGALFPRCSLLAVALPG